MIYNISLFIITCFIWGSTWISVHWQLGSVSPLWSVAYRFAIAALLLLGYCVIRGKKMRFPLKNHGMILVQGIFLFSINYICFYLGLQYLVSGLGSLIYALIVIANIILARIFFNYKLEFTVILGAVFGLIGLVTVFSGQFRLTSTAVAMHQMAWGAGMCILATFLSSLGNMASMYNRQRDLPILQTNAYSMLYGAIIAIIVTLVMRIPISFDWHPMYIGNLLYLAVIGSVIAFGTYLELLNNLGPGKAAYVFVVIPIISLLFSTFFESFTWTTTTFIGLFIILLGNLLILIPSKKDKIESEALEAIE